MTVKLTASEADRFVPVTVTVAVYVLAASPVFGLTVNVRLLPAAILLSDVADKVNEVRSVPDKATVREPVAVVPRLVMVTV